MSDAVFDESGFCFGVECANRRRVYVAARYALKYWAREVAHKLRDAGFEVTSTWHDEQAPHTMATSTEAQLAEWAERDERQIRRATHLVRLSDGQAGTGGNLVEWGLAGAWGLRRLLIGPHLNVFDFAPGVARISERDLIEEIRK